jgi:hypothetical protein
MNKFKEILARVRAYVARMFRNQEPAKPAKPRKKIQQQSREHMGAHYYLGDLLDQLDNSFKSLDTLKKVNREAYKTFSKVSCHVSSKYLLRTDENQYSITRDQIPAIGCSFLADVGDNRVTKVENGDEFRAPTFCYFKRIKNPINVQQTNGITLEVCLVFEFKSGPQAVSYHVSIDEDMNIKPLKELHIKNIPVRPKISRKNNRPFSISRAYWQEAPYLSDMAKDNNETIERAAETMTWIAINSVLAMDSGVHVRVAKGSKRVTFAIDMMRTPYFFKDRDKVVNENGATKKIFHIVAAHERTLASGEKKTIKSHFRGIRKFMWNGYKINILLSGKHATSFNNFTSDAIEVAESDTPKGFVSMEQAASKISETLDMA